MNPGAECESTKNNDVCESWVLFNSIQIFTHTSKPLKKIIIGRSDDFLFPITANYRILVAFTIAC